MSAVPASTAPTPCLYVQCAVRLAASCVCTRFICPLRTCCPLGVSLQVACALAFYVLMYTHTKLLAMAARSPPSWSCTSRGRVAASRPSPRARTSPPLAASAIIRHLGRWPFRWCGPSWRAAVTRSRSARFRSCVSAAPVSLRLLSVSSLSALACFPFVEVSRTFRISGFVQDLWWDLTVAYGVPPSRFMGATDPYTLLGRTGWWLNPARM